MTAGLFVLTFAFAAPPPTTGLQKGDTFTFTGTVAEGVDRPADRFRRNHALELRTFVLDRQENWADVAVLTRLERTEDAVGGAVGAVTGNGPEKNAPPSVRLDLVRVYNDGTVHILLPPGPPPLKFSADTPARAAPPIPLDSFAASEFGIFPPHPPRNAANEPWIVAATGDRPPQTWQARGTEFVNAEQCRVLVMNQKSPDWDRPVGGQTSWLRADQVWVSTQDGTTRKVHRVIKQRDGKAENPSAWVEVKYELKDPAQLKGLTFDRTRRDVEVAYTALCEAMELVPNAKKLGPRTFERCLAKLDDHLKTTAQTSPYREAMQAARRLLDAARRGDVSPVQPVVATSPLLAPGRSLWPEAGQFAPDFQAGAFRLTEHRSKPVVLIFFKPGSETTDLSLAIADALEKRYTRKVVVAAFAVFGDSAVGVKDRDRLKFTVPIYDGSAAVEGYGIETAPRFALIDTSGRVCWAFTSVGKETGFLLNEQVDRLISPASPDSATGTTVVPVAPTPLPKARR